MISIGQKIYIYRLRKGLTQEQLAAGSGVAQANISNFEKGKRDITINTLFRLCLALEVSPAEIFAKEIVSKHENFTRQRVERIARAIVNENVSVSKEDRRIVDLIKPILSQRGRPVSSKKTDVAWNQVHKHLSDKEITIILERVNDQAQRQHA